MCRLQRAMASLGAESVNSVGGRTISSAASVNDDRSASAMTERQAIRIDRLVDWRHGEFPAKFGQVPVCNTNSNASMRSYVDMACESTIGTTILLAAIHVTGANA